jgi:protein TilB
LFLLQDNCIEKIENLGRLKMLQYLNLAMNNIEKVENTEGLESLEKLDLTLNFIGEITSISLLQHNEKLTSLFLMGNPCAEFEFYRQFVIATLTSLEFLDGSPIDKSERIQAIQQMDKIKPKILAAQDKYLTKRLADKVTNLDEIKAKMSQYDNPELDLDTKRQKFYQSESKHNPEFRKESIRFREYLDEMDEKKAKEPIRNDYPSYSSSWKPTHFFNDQGKPLNINQAKIDFHYDDSDDINITVEIMTYKHLDMSLIELDVQPTYLR